MGEESFFLGPSYDHGTIHKIDPITGADLYSFLVYYGQSTMVNSNPRGLAWDGTSIWAGFQIVGKIIKFDLNGNILTSFDSPFGFFQQGLEYDGQYLWATGDNYNIAQIDPTSGQVIYSFNLPLDNLPSDIPEPATMLLLGLGLMGLAGVRRRMRKIG